MLGRDKRKSVPRYVFEAMPAFTEVHWEKLRSTMALLCCAEGFGRVMKGEQWKFSKGGSLKGPTMALNLISSSRYACTSSLKSGADGMILVLLCNALL